MNPEKQKLLIEYLLSSVDVFAITNNIIKAEYFEPEYRNSIIFIKNYYNDHRDLPDLDQVYAEADIKYKLQTLDKSKTDYCIIEIEQFCKHKAIEHAILKSPALMLKGDYGAIETIIKKAVTTSIHRSVGVSFFDDPEGMIQRLLESPAISTGYLILDEYLDGGARRKELILVSANSGEGKSILMANMGLNFAEQGLVVLYLSLELPVDMIWKRYVSMVTNVTQREIIQRSQEVITQIKGAKDTMGDIIIERLSVGTTANEIRAFLREFELKRKCIPDVIILDYLDLMGPNEHVSADNLSEKDKRCTEQFSQIAYDYNAIGLTASQQTKSTDDSADRNHSNIAGGKTKINTTDVYITIFFSNIMKATGEMMLKLLKTRSSDGVGKFVHLKWMGSALRVLDSTKRHSNELETAKSVNPIEQATTNHRKTNTERKLTDGARRSQLLSMFSGLDDNND
jgi:replicative DNA helicase